MKRQMIRQNQKFLRQNEILRRTRSLWTRGKLKTMNGREIPNVTNYPCKSTEVSHRAFQKARNWTSNYPSWQVHASHSHHPPLTAKQMSNTLTATLPTAPCVLTTLLLPVPLPLPPVFRYGQRTQSSLTTLSEVSTRRFCFLSFGKMYLNQNFRGAKRKLWDSP